MPIEILDRESLRAKAPYLADNAIGAGFCPTEGKANPLKATPALAAAAERLGATILTKTRILALEAAPGGYSVQTSAGPISARRVVNAAGAAAADIAAMLGVAIDLQGVPLQVTVTEPVAPLIPHLVYSAAGKLSLKQALNGSCLIGGGWLANRRDNGELVTNPSHLSGNMINAAKVAPAIAQARAVRSWTATVNGTDDWRPIIGEVPGHKGFFLSLFPWVGFSAGPVTRTGNPLDTAIEGEGFFVVQTENGEAYTRDGGFTRDAQGQLMTRTGRLGMGDGGPIAIDPEAGAIEVRADGTITQNEIEAGRLRVVAFDTPEALEKLGNNLWAASGEQPRAPDRYRVAGGFLEQSNVNAVLELTEMISISRSYQSVARIISQTDELRATSIDKLARLT